MLIGILLGFTELTRAQSAKVENTWIEHDVTQNGETGMRIHTKVTVNGLKGNKVRVQAMFYDSNKNYLNGGIYGYRTADGHPCVSEDVIPSYESSLWEDFNLFMPNSAIPMTTGTNTYYIAVFVQDRQSGKWLVSTPTYIYFFGSGTKNSNDNTPSITFLDIAGRRNVIDAAQKLQAADAIYIRGIAPAGAVINYNGSNSNGSGTNANNSTNCPTCLGSGTCCGHGLSSSTLRQQYCGGSGRCSMCGGTGVINNQYTGNPMKCSYCNGTGRCSKCNGTGRCSSCGGTGKKY